MKGLRISASRFASLIPVGLVLVALMSGALADAQSQPSEDRPHLLVVPDSAEGEVALERTDARVIARYESFSLVEAAGADDERLRAAGAARRDDMHTVTTAAGELDPTTARRSLAGKEAPERDEVLALLQFVGPPKDAWLERLRATGARIVTYQAENAYVVHAGGGEVERLAALVGGYSPVRAVSVLTAADKLESPSSPTGRYAVQTVTGAEGADARADAAAAGAGVSPSASVGEIRTQYLQLTDAEAAELARDPAVVAVEPYGEPELADERAAQIVAGNLTAGFAPDGPGYLDWLVDPDRIPDDTTFDFAIDVTDEGLDDGLDPSAHPDFRALGASSGASRLAYRNDYSTDSGPNATRDCGGHGTNVASIAGGYPSSPPGEDAQGYDHGLGVAPFAKLGVSKIFNCTGGFGSGLSVSALAASAYAGSARVSNNSWGTNGVASWSDYSARSREYDEVVRAAGPEGMTEVFAAGNDGDDVPGGSNEGYGTILAEATAKNVITVGGSEGVRASGTDGCGVTNPDADSADDIVNFSSRGPTDDGRLKPDLVAPGTHVTGARPQHTGYTGYRACTDPFGGPFYTLISGSSQAAPQVAGAAALVRHWYERTEGGEPSPAMVKALLINSATDLAGGNTGKGATIGGGPSTDQGWGRVNVGAALGSTQRVYRDQEEADTFDNSGEARTRSYRAQPAGAPVKVTLVWTDAPGSTMGASYVNNLDLEVVAGGKRYLGNVFGGSFSRTGGAADTRNNVESVHLPADVANRFSVTVKGLQITGDGVPGSGDLNDQDFALVVSNAVEQDAPVLGGEATTIDDALLGDGDGALESDEEVALDQEVRNSGTQSATGVAGTLSSTTPSLSVTQPISAYPALPAGSSAANTVPFRADLANSAVCGQDVSARLDLTAIGPEAQSIPLLLPTGELGPPLQSDVTTSLPIPDDNGAGATSTLFVPQRGRIKDLNVRLGSPGSEGIVHEYVGDVTIDLTSPQGTTVRLAEHPGGPDNNGRDFEGTVFDDSAAQPIGASGSAPYTGSFRPQNDQLSRFDGESRRGTWTLRVRDSFENDTGTILAWGLTTRKAVCDIDTTPPDTDIVGSPADPTNDTSPTFAFESPDDAGATFECRLDSGDYEPCTSPRTLSSVGAGAHTFSVRAIDGSDNEDPAPASHTWTTDTTPPDTAIADGPAAGSFTTSTSAAFTYTSEPQARFECSLDGGTWTDCDTQPKSYTGLGAGTHTFAVRALDLAGNADPVPATRSWTIDLVAPNPSVDAPAASTPDSQPTLTGTGSQAPGDAGSVTVRIYPGKGHADLSAVSPVYTLPVALSADGRWSVEVPASLGIGDYTVQAEQVDSAGNVNRSGVVVFTVVPDTTAPSVRLTAPANGSTTTESTPAIAGVAGTTPGDDGTVLVKLWSGTLAAGLPAQTIIVPRDGAGGAFSATPAALADGTYTVRAEQGDSGQPAENIGTSAPVTFTVDRTPSVPPSFVAAPVEERLSDALAGRYTVTAACATACRVSARLTAGSRSIGSGSKRLARSASAAVRLQASRAARRALRGRRGVRAMLKVTVSAGDDRFTLKRPVTLSRSAGLRTLVKRGLGLWAVCSQRCPLSGELTVSKAEARRLKMKPGRAARLEIAGGRVRATANASRLTLRLARKARKAVARARKLNGRVELVAGSAPDNDSTALRRLAARR